MKKIILAIAVTMGIFTVSTVKASALTAKVYRADKVSYQYGMYQIQSSALSPVNSYWTWANNGIPVNKVNWVNAKGGNIADGADKNFKAGMYFTLDTDVVDGGGGHYVKNGKTVAKGTAGSIYYEKFLWSGNKYNYSWLTPANKNLLLYDVNPPAPKPAAVPAFNAATLATNFIKAVKGKQLGMVNLTKTTAIKLAGSDVANKSYAGYSGCVALANYYLHTKNKALSGTIYGMNVTAAFKLKASANPVVGGLFSVHKNSVWSSANCGPYGHTGIVIGVKSGTSFTTLENCYAGGFYQVTHPWKDVKSASFTVAA